MKLQSPKLRESAPWAEILKVTSPNINIALPPTWNSLSPGATVRLCATCTLLRSRQPVVAPQIVLSYAIVLQSLLTSVRQVMSTFCSKINFFNFSIFNVSFDRWLETNPIPPGLWSNIRIQFSFLRRKGSPWCPLSWFWPRLWSVKSPLVWATSHDRGGPGHLIRGSWPLQTKRTCPQCWRSRYEGDDG